MATYEDDNYRDVLIESEDDPYERDPSPPAGPSYAMLNPMIYINYLLEFIASYGWPLLFGAVVAVYLGTVLRARYKKLQQKWDDAEYHKDPDKALARMEAIQRAREAQQRRLEEASQRAREQQLEREERRRAEAQERLRQYGSAAGQRLGSGDDGYLPLSGGASGSSYRPPKRSKCGGGGCGR